MLDLSSNHFKLLGLPVAYRLDERCLAERYHALQRLLHPDRFAAAGERERRLSLQASTQVNEAYQTLRDPLRRAQYLLGLLTGEPVAGAATGADAAFLMEQMELREALAAARDRADPRGEVELVLGRLAAQSGELVDALERLFARAGEEELSEARRLVLRLQFVVKAQAEAERVAAELDEWSAP